MSEYHRPIMVDEVLAGLNIRRGGVYFDGTLGGSGHSGAILAADPTVRLIATDKDGDAIAEAERALAPYAGRFSLFRTDFKCYREVLQEAGVTQLDGFLLDLGLSSHQVNTESRGFGYRMQQAPLDMRMDTRAKLTAEEVVNTYSEEALRRIFREYGEETFAGAVARNIVRAREKQRIATTGELERLTEAAIPPKYRSPACARKVFQAIRIEVNGELDGLYECILGLMGILKKGGRACILTFHSLEDRIVKQAFKELACGCECPKSFPVCVCGKRQQIEILTKKPIVASEREKEENTRSKSAKLRIAEKIE